MPAPPSAAVSTTSAAPMRPQGPDLGLEHRRVVLGGVVLGVLLEIAPLARDRDALGDLLSRRSLERLDPTFSSSSEAAVIFTVSVMKRETLPQPSDARQAAARDSSNRRASSVTALDDLRPGAGREVVAHPVDLDQLRPGDRGGGRAPAGGATSRSVVPWITRVGAVILRARACGRPT